MKNPLSALPYLAAFLLFVFAPLPAAAGERVLNILYTGAIRGELEPCGCAPETQSGGLARLSGFINGEKEGLDPFILVDAGNSLAEDTPQGRLKTEALIRSFGIIGYDAAAFFEVPDYAGPFLKETDLKAVSASKGLVRSVLIRRGRLKINISIDPKSLKKGMLNLLLTDKPVTEAASRGWDVVITSSGEAVEGAVKTNGAIVASGYPKGEKLGVLALRLDEKGRVSGFDQRWQMLGKDVSEDKRVREVIKEYDAKVAELTKDEEKKMELSGPWLGAASCIECHESFFESWAATRHAKAFESLEKVGKSKDPECIACHTTGYGKEGGFKNKTATPGLTGVQCEVCHGPGKDHARGFSAPSGPVNETVCLKCHTKENSPEFDYELYREKIIH